MPLPGGKTRALLAYLLLHANEPITRDRLIDAIWGEEPPPTAANALQVHVHGLRRVLGRDRIVTRGSGYALRVDAGELDLDRFRRLLARGTAALGMGRAEEADRLLAEALGLWRGEPLAGQAGDPFAATEVGPLEELRLAAVERRIEAALELGRHDDALRELERVLPEEPLRESLRALQMLALYRAGRQADALAAYTETRRLLVDELGIEPGRALQELELRILRQDPGLERRQRPPRRGSVPVPATPLVGRGLELAATSALIRGDDVRLLTLCGPGGTGKTRLALALAAELEAAFPDGAAFVDLAPVEDEALVPAAVAAALEVTEAPGRPLVDSIADAVRGLTMLVVVDNFEHVLGAAPLVAALLAAAPDSKLLVTSRAPLRIAGEHAYDVPPLDVPDPSIMELARLAENEAVRLFVARARAATRSFELTAANAPAVAAICRGVDGLPLGIELAAARCRLFAPDVLAARLGTQLALLTSGTRDAPARQRTLRATIDWSYRLLTADERRVFARLGVFAGGCTIEAAEVVCDADVDSVAALVDNSLVQRADDRLSLLETVRQYALERLEEAGDEPPARRAHADHFLALAEGLEAGETASLAELEREHDNLRAALAFARQQGSTELHLRLCNALWLLWYVRGFLSEGRAEFEAALSAPGAAPALRAEALRAAAVLAWAQGDLDRAEVAVEESIPLYRSLGDEAGLAGSLITAGLIAQDRGDLALARERHEESWRLARATGHRPREGAALANLGDVALLQGDVSSAWDWYRRSEAVCAASGDQRGRAIALLSFGILSLRAERDVAAARRWFRESLEISVAIAHTERVVSSLTGLAAATAPIDAGLAARMLGAAAALRESMGLRIEAWWEQPVIDELTVELEQALGAGFANATAAGRSRPDETVREALGDG